MKKIFSVCIILSVLFSGCNDLKEEIDDLYQQIQTLKAEQMDINASLDQMNSSLESLQKIVFALQSGVYIKSVRTVDNGYIISLSNGENLTITNGKNGVDGKSPAIGVKFDAGVYYWTLNGECMIDGSGKKIRADGATPLFDIRDDYWYVSFDGGTTWQQLSKAIGEDGLDGLPGDQIFKDVQYSPGGNVVVFILQDGTAITVPCYQAISISFNVTDNVTSITAGETIKVDYTLSYGDDNTIVTAFADGNYAVSVQKKDNVSGTILITCQGLYSDGHINVMAFDGIGYASIGVITFYEKKMMFGSDLTVNLPTEKFFFQIPLSYNFEYYVEVDNNSSSWLTLTKTKAETKTGVISVTASKNDGDRRTGYIYIYSDNTIGKPFAVITVNQAGAYYYVDQNSFVFSSDGGNGRVCVESSRGVSYSIVGDGDWVSAEVITIEEDKRFEVDITVAPNTTQIKRSAKVLLMPKDGSSVQSTVDIVQFGYGGDNEMDLVFEVRATKANQSMVYLPIYSNDWDNSFVIDWGDGSYDSVNPDRYGDRNGKTWHLYDEINKSFIVRVSGTVHRLDSGCVPEPYRSGVIGVKQWGNTGLTSMDNAFSNFNGLEYLADDNTMAFAEVHSFNSTFINCPRLKSLPSGLFKNAQKAYYFDFTFYQCESLTTIPDSLFSGCEAANSFNNTFGQCHYLRSIPSSLFVGCVNARYFDRTFENCHNLNSIPENLFVDCVNAENFSYTFLSCYNLNSLPENLFSSCENAKFFSGTFENCQGIEAIPAKLFANTRKVESFESCFNQLTKLKSIPADLFANSPDASNFGYTFYYCISLEEIPTSLFDNQRKVKNFNWTFAQNYNLNGESPYTVVNGEKVHLYERVEYPDYFVTPVSHDNCFMDSWNLVDFLEMPSGWTSNY